MEFFIKKWNKNITLGFVVVIVFVLVGCASLFTVSVGENGKITYELVIDESVEQGNPNRVYAIITQYNGTDTDISIPDTVYLKNPVRIIGENAFAGKGLKNVIIPDSVLSIRNNAFANNQLTEITIPRNVREIGNNAFRNNQLNNVTFPSSISTIGANAFDGNPSLVNIPKTVQQQQQIQNQKQQAKISTNDSGFTDCPRRRDGKHAWITSDYTGMVFCNYCGLGNEDQSQQTNTDTDDSGYTDCPRRRDGKHSWITSDYTGMEFCNYCGLGR